MSYEKNITQVAHKPLKVSRLERFNKAKDRKFGKNLYKCRRCRRTKGIIRQYGLLYCRQCFREEAERLGFRKYE